MAIDFEKSDKLSTHGFYIQKINGTNAYVVMVQKKTAVSSVSPCKCDMQVISAS